MGRHATIRTESAERGGVAAELGEAREDRVTEDPSVSPVPLTQHTTGYTLVQAESAGPDQVM